MEVRGSRSSRLISTFRLGKRCRLSKPAKSQPTTCQQVLMRPLLSYCTVTPLGNCR